MKTILVSLFMVVVVGCGGMKKPPAESYNQRQLRAQQEMMKRGQDPHAVALETSGDPQDASLWAKSVGSPYLIRNQKAQKIGDLLTIVIDETATATTSAKTGAKRDGTVDISGTLSAGQSESEQWGTLSAKTQHKNDFKGEGSTDRSGRFQATVQAVVEDVIPNGNLFIRGHKVITINNEDQEVEISGFVRPDDIRINNTVLSRMLADAEVRYIGNGVISDKQKTGWGTRLLDAIWPF